MATATSSGMLSLEKPYQAAVHVNFRILNDKHEEKIYLENKPSDAVLELTNISSNPLYFIPLPPDTVPGPESYHLRLQFRPGVIKTGKALAHKINELLVKGWSLTIAEEPLENNINEMTAVFYFINRNNAKLHTYKKDSKALLLPIKNIVMDCKEGTQVTQVELNCSNFSVDKEYLFPIANFTRHFSLTIINHRGNPHIPIHVGFTDIDTILNDRSPNSLTLRITNLQKKTPEHDGKIIFSHRKHSRMYLYFVTDTELEKSDYALGTVSNVSAIDLDTSRIPHQKNDSYLVHELLFEGDTPVWEIYPEDGDVVLQPHLSVPAKSDSFDIILTGIITDFFNGVTHLFLRLENIPGYWDHTYAIPIVKQPLVIKDKNIGIGVNNPKERLDVKGNIQISNADIPMGLMTEVGGKTPLLNMSVNFRESNKTTINRGAAFRIDTRNGSPLFQWLSRLENSTDEKVVLTLGDNGDLNARGRVKDSSGFVMPVGSVIPYAGKTAPDGWLMCNGATYPVVNMPDLYAVIGNTYGGDANSFLVPDLRSRFIAGSANDAGYQLGNKGGANAVKLEAAHLPPHSHPVSLTTSQDGHHQHNYGTRGFLTDIVAAGKERNPGADGSTDGDNVQSTWGAGTHTHSVNGNTGESGGGGLHENRPPYVALNYIIKT